MPYQNILYEKEGKLARITLNRPEKLNALNPPLLADLEAALKEADEDAEVSVIILRGAGRAFCAGYDLTPEGEGTWYAESGGGRTRLEKIREKVNATFKRWFDILWHARKPSLAQVHGYCLAGGTELALMCDLTVVAEDAQLGYPQVRIHGPSGAFFFPWLVGLKKGKELLLTGDSVDGREAVRLGLANLVVPASQLEEATTKLAKRIASTPVEILTLSKTTANRIYETMGMRVAIEWSLEMNTLAYFTDFGAEWDKLLREKGLQAALEWRDKKFGER